MRSDFSTESGNWALPSYPTTFTSTLPNYEDSRPVRVNREGVQNYVKNRGSLNIGDWAIEGRRMSTSTVSQQAPIPGPKVFGSEATNNYTRSRGSTPNLIYGNLEPPNPHHNQRVKREGRANYDRNHQSEMSVLLHSYGKLPVPERPMPNTKGALATQLFYTHQEGQMGPLLNNYGRDITTQMPAPNVKGTAAETNLQKGQGDSDLLVHLNNRPVETPEPNLKGVQAHLNYDMGRGRHVDELFHHYGRLPQAARLPPKVKPGGRDNFIKDQGDSMRKTLSQCPPTGRYDSRPQSVPLRP